MAFFKQSLARVTLQLKQLHRDQNGSISIISVFTVILLVMLFGLVLNSGKQVDQRVKMQNVADASTYSGSVVISRGLNTIAFTNHLLCDVFALTAFMREARDRNAETLTDEILDNWERVGPAFAKAGLPDFGGYAKFGKLGQAITDKVPHERELVARFGDWASAASEIMLPVFEEILAEEQIPDFQHAVIRTTPQLAQIAADEVARRHGISWPQRATLHCVLWRTNGSPMFAVSEEDERWLPVVDPARDEIANSEAYKNDAISQRFALAHRYLEDWNDDSLSLFDGYVKMSQLGNLWRVFTGGHLQLLLEEYPASNLPFQILTRPEEIENLNGHLEYRYMLVGIVYREKVPDEMPGIFHNPVPFDTQAYAQAMVYVPRRRLEKRRIWPDWRLREPPPTTGVPGQRVGIEKRLSPNVPPPEPPDEEEYAVRRQDARYYPEQWSLVAQNWSSQLVPATCAKIPQMLGEAPSWSGPQSFSTPPLTDLGGGDFRWLSNH